MSDPLVSAGTRLRAALEAERPLQVVGTVNAYCALLAARSACSSGLPTLGRCSPTPATRA